MVDISFTSLTSRFVIPASLALVSVLLVPFVLVAFGAAPARWKWLSPNIFLHQLIVGIDLYETAEETGLTWTFEGSSQCLSSQFLVVHGLTYMHAPAPLSFQLDDTPMAVQQR